MTSARRTFPSSLAGLLASPEWREMADVSHKHLLNFVADYFWRKRTSIILLHHAISVVLTGLLIVIAALSDSSVEWWMGRLGLAVVLLLVAILPLHEVIHAIAYRLQGARDIRWGIQWMPLAVYVVAHDFVVNRAMFTFLALAPTVIIGAALLVCAAAGVPDRASPLMLALLHHGGTAGDWALLNFFLAHGGTEIVTVDDADRHRSLFFERVRNIAFHGSNG